MSLPYAHSVDMALKNLSNGSVAVMLGVVTVVVTVVAVIMGFATSQMFGLTSRIDTLFTDSASIKADAARTATAVDYMKGDIAEMKATLKDVSTTLQAIDKKLAAAADTKGAVPANFVMFKDPTALGKFLLLDKIGSVPIYVQSPDPKVTQILDAVAKQ
jgi:hypothetical protein